LPFLIFFQSFENFLINIVLIKFSLQDGVRIDGLLLFDHLIDKLDLLRSFLILLFLHLFLQRLAFFFSKYLIDREVDLPKYTLDQRGNDVHNDDMHEAEVYHHIGVVLRVSPTVVIGDHRPPRLRQYLHHDVMSLDKVAER